MFKFPPLPFVLRRREIGQPSGKKVQRAVSKHTQVPTNGVIGVCFETARWLIYQTQTPVTRLLSTNGTEENLKQCLKFRWSCPSTEWQWSIVLDCFAKACKGEIYVRVQSTHRPLISTVQLVIENWIDWANSVFEGIIFLYHQVTSCQPGVFLRPKV